MGLLGHLGQREPVSSFRVKPEAEVSHAAQIRITRKVRGCELALVPFQITPDGQSALVLIVVVVSLSAQQRRPFAAAARQQRDQCERRHTLPPAGAAVTAG